MFKLNITQTWIEDTLLFGVLFFSPFAFGSVHVWEYLLLSLASLFLFNLRFTHDTDGIRRVVRFKSSRLILAFLFINSLYVVPLPYEVIKLVHPLLVSMRADYMLEIPYWQTISVYPRATVGYLVKLVSYIFIYFVIVSKITQRPESERQAIPRSIHTSFIVFGFLSGMLAILFHSFVDFNLHIPANALYFTVLCTGVAGLSSTCGTRHAMSTSLNYSFVSKLVNSIVIIGFLVALFGIIQWFSWNGNMFWIIAKPGQNFGPYVCYNHFAGFMEMTSFTGLALCYSGIFTSPLRHMKKINDKVSWFFSPEANKTILYLFMTIIMIAAMFLSSSRGGIISFAVAFTVFAVTCIAIGPRSRKLKLTISITLVIGLFVAMIVWVGPENTIMRFKSLVVYLQILFSEGKIHILRWSMWSNTLDLIMAFPITGTGLGTYSDMFMPFRTFPAHFGRLLYAHQDYLHLLSETGMIGCGFLILFLLWYLRRFRECIGRLRLGAEHLEAQGHIAYKHER